MVKMRTTLILCLVFALAMQIQSQDIGYGFRAGLSYSKYTGDLEVGADGQEIESYSFTSGFHIGFTFNYRITDLFGLRTELLFAQRGTKYDYNGESWFILGKGTEQERILPGTRIMSNDVSTARIEIPLTAYHKIGPFELSGGVNCSFLLGASGGGSLNYEGYSANSGNPVDPFELTLNYNYFKDEAGAASAETIPVVVDGLSFEVPQTLGAYYNFTEKDGNYYNTIDLGIHAGLAFFLNESLFIGGRVNFGLLDVDDNQYDISLREINPNRTYIQREDKNTSLSIQASVGFSF